MAQYYVTLGIVYLLGAFAGIAGVLLGLGV